MPKITRHGGPTHAGHNPPGFGAALAAARSASADLAAAESAMAAPVDARLAEAEQQLEELRRQVAAAQAFGFLPADTPPGCLHPDCVLTHPHAGPALLAATGGVVDGELLATIGENGPELLDLPEGAEVKPATDAEGGEQSSPGTSSSTSPKKPRKNTASGKPPRQSPARTTGSRSKTAPVPDSTAGSVDESATNSETAGS